MPPERLVAEPSHELDAPPWQRVDATIMATSRALRRAYDLRLTAVGLNLSEACVLAFVHTGGPATQTRVADRIGMGRAAAGAVVDALERRSLVVRERSDSDRRVWVVALTPEGDACVDRIRDIDAALRADLRAGISKTERTQLASTLIRLQDNLAGVLEPDGREP